MPSSHLKFEIITTAKRHVQLRVNIIGTIAIVIVINNDYYQCASVSVLGYWPISNWWSAPNMVNQDINETGQDRWNERVSERVRDGVIKSEKLKIQPVN